MFLQLTVAENLNFANIWLPQRLGDRFLALHKFYFKSLTDRCFIIGYIILKVKFNIYW